MTLHTAPCNQGQIVTYSFGWDDGAVYMRVHDASEGTLTIYRATPDYLWLDEDELIELEAWDPRVDPKAPAFLDFTWFAGDPEY